MQPASFDLWLGSLRDQTGTRDGKRDPEGGFSCKWTDDELIGFIVRLFADAPRVLDKWTDLEVKEGLGYLIRPGDSNMLEVLVDSRISLPKRVRCVESVRSLFASYFDARCNPALSHEDDDVSPINQICFMWWDIFPVFVSLPREEQDVLDLACIEVMQDSLQLQNIACKESAIHGLGHWWLFQPEKARAVIDRSMASVPEALVQYARSARAGHVQ